MQFKCNEKINKVTENTLVVGMDIDKMFFTKLFKVVKQHVK